MHTHLKVPEKVTVTNFNTSWCGHSRHLQPTWDKIMKEFQTNNAITVVDMKCDAGSQEEAQCQADGIQGFPTIILTRPDGKAYQYQGDRSFEDIKDWILKLST